MRLFNSGTDQYRPKGLVLEVACGTNPAPESDVLLEFYEPFVKQLKDEWVEKVVFGDALNMPFLDRSFDYITCMHLVEHFDHGELIRFFSELRRVAPRGYIEAPSIYWELLHNCDEAFCADGFAGHHKQYCFFYEGVIHFIKKADSCTTKHRIIREVFRKIINPAITADNIDLMMVGVQWEQHVNFQFHESLEDIPCDLFDAIIERVGRYASEKKVVSPLRKVAEQYGRAVYKKIMPAEKKKKAESLDMSKLLKSTRAEVAQGSHLDSPPRL